MIFDTDVLLGVMRHDPSAIGLVEPEAERALSIVSLIELIQGANSKAEVPLIRSLLIERELAVIPIDEPISYLASELIERHAHADRLRLADALIAATARNRGEVLATGNVRHFRVVAGLELKPFRPRAPRNRS